MRVYHLRRGRRSFKESDTGFRGVSRHSGMWQGLKYTSGFRARITIDRRTIHLGVFSTAQEAASAYDRAAIERFGDLAVTNGTVVAGGFDVE